MANTITKSIELEDGRVISIETGKLAKQADGAVVVRCGNTMLLATVVSESEPMEGVDFFPLMVEYKEKFSATGKFPGGFYKREARPSVDEVLVCRLVDRALRPLFPDGYRNNTQVIIQLISADEDNMPDSLAGLAASACIAVSDIPFNGPISEVRVARINGNLVINPKRTDLANSDIDMIVAASATDVIMVEGEMKEISEEEMLEAIKFAHTAIKQQIQLQLELSSEVEKSKVKRAVIVEEEDEELLNTVKENLYQKYYNLAKSAVKDKHERKGEFKQILKTYLETFNEETLEEKGSKIKSYASKVEKEAIRNLLLDEKIRLDGRGTKDIRPIEIEIGLLPGPHGSSLFTRGETQSLTTVTLGTKLDEQTIDGVTYSGSEKFLLHYNFPPFSTKEAKMMRSTSRREIGHGNLALRALTPVLPKDKMINPYTIRVVSDILESNGSSSMATVCAGSLALMDAGVKVSKPVSGIAMGLISDESGRNVVLSDILGDEDHLGDMDFKVTGTKDGITACQMDIKIAGLSFETLQEALLQAKDGRLHILNEMSKVIDTPREDYKAHAPRIISFEIPKEMIGAVIGPGGKVIQEIQADTDTVIVLEEEGNVGLVNIYSNNQESMEEANRRVRRIAFPPVVEVGKEYEGKVKSVVPYGAFVEIIPGTDGLLHVSELEWRKVEKVEEVLKEGQLVKFKVVGVDPRNGKYKLSRKVLLPKETSKN